MTRRSLINGLHFDNLAGDVVGGLTAAVVALPLALAFGIASGAGPLAGLYGAVALGLFASLFGGTPAQISGPTGPMTVVMAAVIIEHSSDPAVAFTIVMMAGAFQVLLGAVGIGRFMLLMPMPVVSGFMSGVGCIIIALQLPPLFGYGAASTAMSAVAAVPEMMAAPDWGALALGALSIGVVVLTPNRIGRKVPSPLLALIAGTAAALLLFRDAPVIGEIPSGLPSLVIPAVDVGELRHMVSSAFALALLGMIDSLLTSLVSDSLTHTSHRPDRELVGQGIGNIVAGLIGGIPGAGATMRTVVNVRAGGRTPVSGVVHALALLVVVLWLGPYASRIPLAVLAGILVKVGIDIIDWSYLRRVRRAPKEGVLLMLTVLLLTVFVDLVVAVMVGTVLASLLLVKRMADLQLSGLTTTINAEEGLHLTSEESQILGRAEGGIALFEFRGPFSFGAARGAAERILRADTPVILILDLTEVPMIDSSAALAIEESVRRASGRHQYALLAGMRPRVRDILDRLSVLEHFPPECIHDTRASAMRYAADVLRLERQDEKVAGAV